MYADTIHVAASSPRVCNGHTASSNSLFSSALAVKANASMVRAEPRAHAGNTRSLRSARLH